MMSLKRNCQVKRPAPVGFPTFFHNKNPELGQRFWNRFLLKRVVVSSGLYPRNPYLLSQKRKRVVSWKHLTLPKPENDTWLPLSASKNLLFVVDHVSKFQLFKVQLQETIPVSSSIFRQPRMFDALPPWKNDQVSWGLLFFSRFASNQRNFGRDFVENVDLDELLGELFHISYITKAKC